MDFRYEHLICKRFSPSKVTPAGRTRCSKGVEKLAIIKRTEVKFTSRFVRATASEVTLAHVFAGDKRHLLPY